MVVLSYWVDLPLAEQPTPENGVYFLHQTTSGTTESYRSSEQLSGLITQPSYTANLQSVVEHLQSEDS